VKGSPVKFIVFTIFISNLDFTAFTPNTKTVYNGFRYKRWKSMENWQDYEQYSSLDLIELIQLKDDPDYQEGAEAAFYAFVFRFRKDILNKCEIICKNWGYDKEIALEIAERTFQRFWKYPKFDPEKSGAKNLDSGVKLYLYGIAKRILTDYYHAEHGINQSPYSGDEEIQTEFPDIDQWDMEPEQKKYLKKQYEIIKKALNRLSESHKIIFLTYKAHEKEEYKMPRDLLKSLRERLNLAQNTIRAYKKEAFDKVNEYLELYGYQ
jgi:RNA polymerase sigma factor (sigma-70 family)